MKRLTKSQTVAFCGIAVALSMLLGYLEHLIPFSVGIYGIKLGLANLSVLCLLYLVDVKYALIVHVLRIALCGLLFGNAFSVIYSFAGGLFSFAVMVLLKKWNKKKIVLVERIIIFLIIYLSIHCIQDQRYGMI